MRCAWGLAGQGVSQLCQMDQGQGIQASHPAKAGAQQQVHTAI